MSSAPQQRLLLETAWQALEDAGEDADATIDRASSSLVAALLADLESGGAR